MSDAVVNEINNHIGSGMHGHGDDLLVFAIPTQSKNITLDYKLKPNTVIDETDIENFIRAAFRESSAYKVTTCKPNDIFSFSVLAGEIHVQFPQLKTLNFTNEDISTGLWLPTIGTLNVSKQS